MWILSRYMYDYYEWEQPFVVSKRRSSLVAYAKKHHESTPFADSSKEHEKLGNREIAHYFIHWIDEAKP